MTAANLPLIVRGDALSLPLAPGSVNLFVTSPPYWALRAYEDAGEFYDGQIGSEPDPVLFLRNLWAAMDEAWLALRDDGVAWVNLGDKYAGSGGHNNSGVASRHGQGASTLTGGPKTERQYEAQRNAFRSMQAATARDRARENMPAAVSSRASRRQADLGRSGPDTRDHARATRRQAPDRYEQGTGWARAKSLMGLPWAFVMGLVNPVLFRDHLDPVPCPDCDPEVYEACTTCGGFGTVTGQHPQWVWRAEQVWDKPNGLPESVKDRPRRTHEVWFLLAKNGDHYGSTDPIREPYNPAAHDPGARAWGLGTYETWGTAGSQSLTFEAGTRTPPDSRGKPPGSVWRIAGEPFVDDLVHLVGDGMRVVDADELAGLNRGRGPLPELIADGGLFGDVEHPERPPLLEVVPAEHFAPFPTEWPRRLVLGWSPEGVCTVCNTGRFPVVSRNLVVDHEQGNGRAGKIDLISGNRREDAYGYNAPSRTVGSYEATMLGHACACTPRTDHGYSGNDWREKPESGHGNRKLPDGDQRAFTERRDRYEYHLDGWDAPPAKPAVVVDMFGGTGTVAMVASVLGRRAVSIDLSWTYSRLAQWRVANPKHRAKVRRRTAAEQQEAIDLEQIIPEPERTDALARDVAHPVHVHTRTADPTTSKRAAVNVAPRAGTQKVKVLAALAQFPESGMTGDDLCRLLGDKNGSSWRSRLASLREEYDPPLVVRTSEERATRSGEQAFVHRITPAGLDVLASIDGAR